MKTHWLQLTFHYYLFSIIKDTKLLFGIKFCKQLNGRNDKTYYNKWELYVPSTANANLREPTIKATIAPSQPRKAINHFHFYIWVKFLQFLILKILIFPLKIFIIIRCFLFIYIPQKRHW